LVFGQGSNLAEPITQTEVPTGHGVFPPFDKSTFSSQPLWLSVIFVLLYVLMARVGIAADCLDT
jgi:F-type H+-transporting ATPase subunit b